MKDCEIHGIPKEHILEALDQASEVGYKIEELKRATSIAGGKAILIPLHYGPEDE